MTQQNPSLEDKLAALRRQAGGESSVGKMVREATDVLRDRENPKLFFQAVQGGDALIIAYLTKVRGLTRTQATQKCFAMFWPEWQAEIEKLCNSGEPAAQNILGVVGTFAENHLLFEALAAVAV